MARICDNSFINRPLFRALRQVYDLPVVNHGITFAPEKEDSEHRIVAISYHDDRHWNKIKPKALSCRLQKHSFYVQYLSEDAGLITLKVNLREAGNRRVAFTFVPAEEFPPCRERKDKAEGENAFYGHDETGTEEWTWSWVETKEDNTRENRLKLLAAYILPSHIEGEEVPSEGIPHTFCLTNYRLCEIRDLGGAVRRRFLVSKYQRKTPDMMHLCCGDIFSSCGVGHPTLLSSGITISDYSRLTNVIGIYSGSMDYCYALCYCFEGLYVVWFKLRTVNP